METYDGFDAETVFFVVLLKVIVDLGARHYAAGSLAQEGNWVILVYLHKDCNDSESEQEEVERVVLPTL